MTRDSTGTAHIGEPGEGAERLGPGMPALAPAWAPELAMRPAGPEPGLVRSWAGSGKFRKRPSLGWGDLYLFVCGVPVLGGISPQRVRL
jgi:hypothetical protein